MYVLSQQQQKIQNKNLPNELRIENGTDEHRPWGLGLEGSLQKSF